MLFHRILIFLLFCGFTPAFAGGTLGFEEVDRLLRQQPTVYKWLASSLVFPDSAFAEIRFGNHFTHLGGGRMGPYSFLAKPRHGNADKKIYVIVCTVATFTDANGKQLPKSKMFTASRVDEKLTMVQVQEESDEVINRAAECAP